jgi:hypothetical protein
MQVLRIDTHLHTDVSFDAGTFGARLMPPRCMRYHESLTCLCVVVHRHGDGDGSRCAILVRALPWKPQARDFSTISLARELLALSIFPVTRQ